MPIPLVPVIAAGAQIAGQALGAITTAKQNKKSRKFAREMYDRQRADALADWNLQNEYNSPSSQMARLKDAGLNPNLVYGNGADAQSSGTVRSSGVPGAQFDAPRFSPGDVMASYFNAKISQAQVDNLRAQNTVITEDAALKRMEQLSLAAGIKKTGVDTDSAAFKLALDQQLRDITLEGAAANVAKTKADTAYTLSSNERAIAMQASNLREAAIRILEARSRMATAAVERQHINAQIEAIKRDNKIKDFEIQLNANGLTKHDALWQRLLSDLVNGDGGLDSSSSGLPGGIFATPSHKRTVMSGASR